ncbi:hypothetical protein [Microbacterium marinilacus]|uniref:Tyr recombinase domain-containing protein n=1 Tax=Microbacterium marinilacus TaxID=415209 RepID=A0ABP7BMC6_9MICO|nr:hypothetical protein [Microbacterium marinilacus]
MASIDNTVPRIPAATWRRIETFVRDAVTVAAPQTSYSAEVLLWAAGQYVAWCVDTQLWPLEAEVIWSRQAIDLYVTDVRQDLAEGTRRNYRARLMRISEVLLPEEHGDAMTALGRKTTAAPYDSAEMGRYRQWAGSQLTPLKRYRAMLMLILCAGAGLRAVEIRDLDRADIEQLDEGFVVRVRGDRAREVPILAVWDEWMRAALEQAPETGRVWGKPNRSRENALLSSFTQYTVGSAPRGDRLRATWLVTHLSDRTPIKELFRAAGFVKFEHLGRLLQHVPDLSPDLSVPALRGEASR